MTANDTLLHIASEIATMTEPKFEPPNPIQPEMLIERDRLYDAFCRFGYFLSSMPHDDHAIFDGLSAEDCLRLFVAEMREDPISVADLRASGYYMLTSAQLIAARALWSARLRAKFTASEAERHASEFRVVVTPEVDPWE